MPFEFSARARVAVIGGGISGLGAAYELAPYADVTLIEAAPRLGGHARTVWAGKRGDQPVDTGFIVFNYHTYPELTRMFGELDVPVAPSDMSFGVSMGGGAFEYGSKGLGALTAQRSNLARPQFWRMLADISRFMRRAEVMAADPALTLGESMEDAGFGEWFRRYYLLPMAGAIWSSTPDQIADFPARSMVQFFSNHGLLKLGGYPWFTVQGGSIAYVDRIAAAIRMRGGAIRTAAPVRAVRRTPEGAAIRCAGGVWEHFDHVILATHADQSLAMLSDPNPAERAILGSFRFQPNRAVLHADPSMMPRRRAAWSSWVFQTEDPRPAPKIGMTYWMNRLQNIDQSDPLFLSLNAPDRLDERLIYDETTFEHPVFDHNAIRAQADLPRIQGRNATWFAGAWTRWGFHEDGYASAVAIARQLRARLAGRVAAE